MKRKEVFTGFKPDGSCTKSAGAYLRAWRSQNRALERRLDVKVISFDPGCVIKDDFYGSVAALPQWLCNKILSDNPE